MITHLGLEFVDSNGVTIRCFQLIDKPFPEGRAFAIRDYHGTILVREAYSDSLSYISKRAFIDECEKAIGFKAAWPMDAVHAEPGYLVTLECGHKLATRKKSSVYICPTCKQSSVTH